MGDTITYDQQLRNINGKYIKQTMERLERLYDATVIPNEIRKIILDGFNDAYRDNENLIVQILQEAYA